MRVTPKTRARLMQNAAVACSNYSRAYLHHLFKAEEVLSLMLLSWHNIQYYQDLMAAMRAAISGGTLLHLRLIFTISKPAVILIRLEQADRGKGTTSS